MWIDPGEASFDMHIQQDCCLKYCTDLCASYSMKKIDLARLKESYNCPFHRLNNRRIVDTNLNKHFVALAYGLRFATPS